MFLQFFRKFRDFRIFGFFFSANFDDFKNNLSDYGGTIIPLLAEKSKGNETINKYSASLFNGYADIAEQVAESKNVKLDTAVGNTNRNAIEIVKIVFYLGVLSGLYLYIKRKIYMKKSANEKK